MLLSWGCGEFGQHGHGHHSDVSFANSELKFFVERKAKVKHMACGASHSIIVTDNNEIYTWGNGNSGQLGSDDGKNHSSPQRIRFEVLLEPIVRAVDCGSRHTAVVTESGRVFMCGNNFNAQLGYDFKTSDYKQHQRKLHLSRSLQHQKVDHVACGSRHTLFLFRTGTVASCGSNSNGQLGQTERADSVVPKVIEEIDNIRGIACGTNHCLAVDDKGHVYIWGYSKALGRARDVLRPRRVNLPRRIAVVSCGHIHSVLLSGSGHTFTFGSGMEGQLGHGEDVSRLSSPSELPYDAFSGPVASVSAGECFSAALTANGELFMWGKNVNRTLSDDPLSKTVWTPGLIDTEGKSVAKITCGAWHMMALTGIPDWEAVHDSDVTQTDTESDSTVTDCSTPERSGIDCDLKSVSSTHMTSDCQEVSEEIIESVEEEIIPEPLSLPPLAVVTTSNPVERVASPLRNAGEKIRPFSHVSHCSSCLKSHTPIHDDSASSVRSKLFVPRGRGSRVAAGVKSRTRLKTSNIELMLNAAALPAVSPGSVKSPGIIPGQPDSIKFQFKKRFGAQMTGRSLPKQRFHLEMHGRQIESSLRGAPGSTSMPSMSDTPGVEAEQKRPSTMSSGEVRRPTASLATEYVGPDLHQWSRNASVAMGRSSVSSPLRRPVGRGRLSKATTGGGLPNKKRVGLLMMQSTLERDLDMRRTTRRDIGTSRIVASSRTFPS